MEQAARNIHQILFSHSSERLSLDTRAAVSDLTYRGLRHWGLAQVRAARLAAKSPDPPILCLLAVAWAALADAVRPAHTIVDEAVAAAKKLVPASAAPKVSGFVKALLRKTLSDVAGCDQDWVQPVARWNAPLWWIQKIQKDYPDQAVAVLDGLRTRAPLTVRLVDASAPAMSAFLEQLRAMGLTGFCVGPQAVAIVPGVPVERIPGFASGQVSVQDAAAQVAATLFSSMSASCAILDACAAPGGKSIALAQRYPGVVWAVDESAARLERLRRDLGRVAPTLRGRLEIRVANLLQESDCTRAGLPQQFDAILFDAPCSASGVVRRHPEIAWKRTPHDLARVVDTQRRLLDTLWRRLKPGGEFVFVTCSIFSEEGEDQVQQFLKRTPDAQPMPSPGRLLPIGNAAAGIDQDGFFYAKFKKQV